MQEKILVVQTAFLGDAVLTLPMIQKLKELFPGSSLTVLCIPSTKEIFEHSPSVNEIIVYDKRNSERSFLSFVKLISLIRRKKFSRIYSPHRSFRSAMMVFFSGSPRTYGFDISSFSFIYKHRIKYISSKHEVARNLDLIQYNTLQENWKILPSVIIPDSAEKSVEKIFDDLGPERVIAIAPGSVWKTKIYPEEHFIELIKNFISKNYFVILIGGSDDEELCRGIASKFEKGVRSVAGSLGIIESTALLKRCSLLICNDSAPTHLGMIADIPTVTIYCSTVPEFGFYPYSRNSRSVSLKGLECKPCGIHGYMECPINTFDCGIKLSPEEVLSEVPEHLPVKGK